MFRFILKLYHKSGGIASKLFSEVFIILFSAMTEKKDMGLFLERICGIISTERLAVQAFGRCPIALKREL